MDAFCYNPSCHVPGPDIVGQNEAPSKSGHLCLWGGGWGMGDAKQKNPGPQVHSLFTRDLLIALAYLALEEHSKILPLWELRLR